MTTGGRGSATVEIFDLPGHRADIVQVPITVLRLPGEMMRVYLALAAFLPGEAVEESPTLPDLALVAQMAGLDVSTVGAAIADLEARGVLQRDGRQFELGEPV